MSFKTSGGKQFKFVVSVSGGNFVFDADLIPDTDDAYYIGSDAIGIKGLHIATDLFLDFDGGLDALSVRDSADENYKSVDAYSIFLQGEGALGLVGDDGIGIGSTAKALKVQSYTTAQKNALTPAIGMIVWDSDLARLDIYTGIWEAISTATSTSTVIIDAKVNEGAGIDAGNAVYISGATGNKPQVSLADNTDDTKEHAIGLAIETKADGQTIRIQLLGEVLNMNTNTWNEGDALFLSTAGDLINTEPTSGAVKHFGHVGKKNVSTGTIVLADEHYHNIGAAASTDLFMRLGDNAGANILAFRDYADNEVASVDSNGVITCTVLDTDEVFIGADLMIDYDNGLSSLSVRNAADNAYKSVDALNYNLQGAAGLRYIGAGGVTIATTLKGFVETSYTTAERNALTAVAGMRVYNSTLAQYQGYIAAWKTFANIEDAQSFASEITFSSTSVFSDDIKLASTKYLYFDGGTNTRVRDSGTALIFDYDGASILTLSATNTNMTKRITLNSVETEFTDDDATPDVSTFSRATETYANPTNVTNFDNGGTGQILIIRGQSGNFTLIHDNTKIVTASGANITLGNEKMVMFINQGGVWYQMGGSQIA